MAELPEGIPIRRLVGVYDAKATIAGELAYWVGARLGRRHCALCDITHGSLREKPTWRACRAEMPVAFETVHLDERDPAVARASDGHVPCVLVETDSGLSVLLDTADLEACAGSPGALVTALARAAETRGLTR